MSRFNQSGVMALPTAFLVGHVVSAEPGEPPVAGQLHALGYTVVDASTVDDLAAAITTATAGPVALVDRRYIGHLHALRRAVCDTRSDVRAGPGTLTATTVARARLVSVLTRMLAGADAGPPGRQETPSSASTSSASTSSASTSSAPTSSGPTSSASTSSAPASSGPTSSASTGPVPGTRIDVGEVTEALAADTDVARTDPAPLVAGLADTQAERDALFARVAAVDEEPIRLRGAVKADDTAFTTFFVRSYSGYVARWFARLGFTPNQVTIMSLAVALGAAGFCATGSRTGLVVGAVLFHLSFALDCIDGDLARYTVRFSTIGSRLDLSADRVKEYVLFAGLAIGAAPADSAIWWLAAAAMAVQTVRHQMHFAYDEVTAGPEAAPALADQVRSRLRGGRWKVWLRRAIVLPQGERSALICLLVAFTTPRAVFVVLLVVGSLAASYAFLGRLLRSLRRLHRPWSKPAGQALGAMVDVGPIGWAVHHALPGRSLPAPLTTLIALAALTFSLTVIPVVGASWLIVGVLWYVLLVGFASQQPLNGWADWVLPPSFRAAEYALAITVTTLVVPSALPVAFCYVAACAFHHYDAVYRLRESGAVPRKWFLIATGGHDGRMVLLALLATGGATVLHVGLVVVTAALAAIVVGESVTATLADVRAERTPPAVDALGAAASQSEVIR
ncbi:DUF5941 domain-containing protein [Actinopolymorpha sp. B17G11]|uniref:DUF5941 domain-containing protein n=1 Tax=Actinopolymorpha sp. B17G11 TaxID=3160861 RepID=UPI0032E4739C